MLCHTGMILRQEPTAVKQLPHRHFDEELAQCCHSCYSIQPSSAQETRTARALLHQCILAGLSDVHTCPDCAKQHELHSLGKHLLQSGDASAFQQADSWVASASAWAARLLAAFPLYRDLLQPVALAVHEMRAGLSMLARAQKGLQSAVQDEQMGLVVAQLGALTPRDCHDGAHQLCLWFIQSGRRHALFSLQEMCRRMCQKFTGWNWEDWLTPSWLYDS